MTVVGSIQHYNEHMLQHKFPGGGHLSRYFVAGIVNTQNEFLCSKLVLKHVSHLSQVTIALHAAPCVWYQRLLTHYVKCTTDPCHCHLVDLQDSAISAPLKTCYCITYIKAAHESTGDSPPCMHHHYAPLTIIHLVGCSRPGIWLCR